MSAEVKREERTDIQAELLHSDLFQEVRATAQALRSSHEYDMAPWSEKGEAAVLCYALQRSADHTSGTCVTYAGVLRTLADLRARAKAGR